MSLFVLRCHACLCMLVCVCVCACASDFFCLAPLVVYLDGYCCMYECNAICHVKAFRVAPYT
jgi:hypothetical protein